jgi:hypothetical protein
VVPSPGGRETWACIDATRVAAAISAGVIAARNAGLMAHFHLVIGLVVLERVLPGFGDEIFAEAVMWFP